MEPSRITPGSQRVGVDGLVDELWEKEKSEGGGAAVSKEREKNADIERVLSDFTNQRSGVLPDKRM
jgi:hypothetical protein